MHSDEVREAMGNLAPLLGAASKNITDLFDAAEAHGLGVPQKAIDGALSLLALSVGWAHNSIGQPTPPDMLRWLLDDEAKPQLIVVEASSAEGGADDSTGPKALGEPGGSPACRPA